MLLVALSGSILGSQISSSLQRLAVHEKNDSLQPLPGCSVLWKQEARIRQYVDGHPEILEAKRLAKVAAWNFKPGQKKSWWATDLVTDTEYLVRSTCRAVGVNAYFFVEDTTWSLGRANQSVVEALVNAFDSKTLASANRGIFQTVVEMFGNPPDVDGDPRIIILILDIKDGFAGSGGFAAGYFSCLNEYPECSIPDRHSNYAEIFYVDSNPLDLVTASGQRHAAMAAAHELQHMIHFDCDPDELTFINESCSMVAGMVCGYPMGGLDFYTQNTDVYLLGWDGLLEDYSRAQRWGLYCWNQFPNGYLKKLVANAGKGITGINNVLTLYTPTTTRRFADILHDWFVANQLNDPSVDPRYAYAWHSDLAKPTATVYADTAGVSQMGSLRRLAADYVTFNGCSRFNIVYSSGSSSLSVKAVETGSSEKRVVDVPTGLVFSETAFGSTYSSITFIVMNLSEADEVRYSFQTRLLAPPSPTLNLPRDKSTGITTTVTLAWNASVGAITYGIQVSSSSLFSTNVVDQRGITATSYYVNGLANNTRYYWRVNAANAGGISAYSSAWRFETRIAVNAPKPPSLSTPADNARNVKHPIILTWSASSDAESYRVQVSHSEDFVQTVVDSSNIKGLSVIAVLGANTKYFWRVSAANYEGGEGAFSAVRTFTTADVTAIGNSARSRPLQNLLRENFPNPPNLTTTIRYELSMESFVSLKVFNILGEEIATLVEEHKQAGHHQILWNATDVPSGTYFYRLQAGDFVETKKMLLVK